MAAELTVQFHKVIAAAFFQNVAAIAHAGLLIEQALLDKALIGITIQHFGPEITVVAVFANGGNF